MTAPLPDAHVSTRAAAMRRCHARIVSGLCASALIASACAPAVHALRGNPTAVTVPSTALPPTPQQLQFTWKYVDDSFEANGEGVVRIGPPHRARLDFFLQNGAAGGMAILVGDSLIIPGIELVRRFLPPVPLLWASLGRLVVPPTHDTTARQDADTLRVEMGVAREATGAHMLRTGWRVGFVARSLVRVERIDGGRIAEWMTRNMSSSGTGDLRYVNESGRRRLTITVTNTRNVEAFDEAIWQRP